ncbi:MAG: hypothetical protein U5K37_09290 [Natrialbaceae archaeon]|nr:hypothetical protein [Natrialbaceae archaeon]
MSEQPSVIDRSEHVVGWLPPNDAMARTSHAIAVDDAVYLVDPVDVDGVGELIDPLGTVAGVILTLDRHRRDGAALAQRYEVPVLLPASFSGVSLDAPVERMHDRVPETPLEVHPLTMNRFWQEVALWWPEPGLLYVPEAVGRGRFFRAGDEPLGVHPMLRLFPPRGLATFRPEILLVGHGGGIDSDATPALETALATSRRRFPRLVIEATRSMLPVP